jgi:hypothetical protein
MVTLPLTGNKLRLYNVYRCPNLQMYKQAVAQALALR